MTLVEQYAPPPQGDDWIEWLGGACPEHPEALVEYRMRGGLTVTRPTPAVCIRWKHTGGASDVVAYRKKAP